MKLYLLFFLPFLFIACSVVPRYEAVSLEEVDYHKGREIIFQQQDGLSAWVVFEGERNNELNFWMKVKNETENKIVVTPNSLFLRFENADEKIYLAQDPEIKIDQIYDEQDDREVEHGVTTGFNVLLAAIGVASGISNESYHEVAYNLDGLSNAQNNENADYDEDLFNLRNELTYWQNDSFRITTLHPEEEIDGYVHFPFKRGEGKFELVIDLVTEDIVFEYQLKEIP